MPRAKPKAPPEAKPEFEKVCGSCGVGFTTHKAKASRCPTCISENNPVKKRKCSTCGNSFIAPLGEYHCEPCADALGIDQTELSEEQKEAEREAKRLIRWLEKVEDMEQRLKLFHGPLKTYVPEYGDRLVEVREDDPKEVLWEKLGLMPPEVLNPHPLRREPVFPTPDTYDPNPPDRYDRFGFQIKTTN